MPKKYPILRQCRNYTLFQYNRKKPKFNPKPNSCRQPIRIEHEKTLKPRQPIRMEYHIAEKTQSLSARVVDPSRLSARLGS